MDRFDKATRSKIMSRIGGKNTKPELIIRSRLHQAGFRFRVHAKELPGKPDIVLPKYQAVIFFNGCFWHGHHCKYGALPKSNSKFWECKISRTKERDLENDCELDTLGWTVFRIWKCEFEDGISKTLNYLNRLRSNQCSIESNKYPAK